MALNIAAPCPSRRRGSLPEKRSGLTLTLASRPVWSAVGAVAEARLPMGILLWILFGLIAGAIAKYLMPGKAPGGILMTIVLGVVGAVVGVFIGAQLGWGDISGFDIRSMLLAVGGG